MKNFTNLLLAFSLFLVSNLVEAQNKSDVRMKLKEAIIQSYAEVETVARFHNLDKDVYRAYDAMLSYQTDKDPQKATEAIAVIGGILDGFEYFKNNPRVKLDLSFFAREKFFKTWQYLKANKLTDQVLEKEMGTFMNTIEIIQERGANNRAANYAIGALEAVKSFPKDPRAKKWKAYAEAVWNDWWEPGDCYEPGYVAHNLPRFITLGVRLGLTKELKSEKLRQTYYRYRDHISSSGLVCQPGDGEPYSQGDYVAAMGKIMEVAPDSTILWALKQAFLAGDKLTGRQTEADFNKAYPLYATMKATAPEVGASVQCTYPATYKLPDRLILAPSRQAGAPFAAFWIQDDCNYLYHGGQSDTRGDLYHYEVDGVILIADRGRYEYPGWNNTWVVADADHEFPFCQTEGIHSNRWYRESANLRVARAYTASDKYYKILDNFNHSGLQSKDSPYGYTWGNPDALSGKNDQMDLKEVKLEFALVPTAGETAVGKVFQGRTWWGGYEYRNVCPSDVPVDVLISDLTISGAAGEKILVPFDQIDERFTFSFVAPNSKQNFVETPLSKDAVQLVTDPETGKKVMKVTTQYGRTVLRVKVNEKFDLTKEYNRINLSYKYVTPLSGWTRVPIQVGINGSNIQNNIVFDDTRQGGIMTDSKAYNRNQDSYGEVSYRSIWTSDSKWTRRTLLTQEGVLLVLDEFIGGKETEGKVAGAIWHLPSTPQCGSTDAVAADWFDASILHNPANGRAFTDHYGEATKRLFIAFKSPVGYVNGIQYQPKHWGTDDYAVYSKMKLEANKRICILSVLVPHDAQISADKIGTNEKNKGLKIKETTPGAYHMTLNVDDKKWTYKPLSIDFNNKGEWNIERDSE